MAVFATIFAGLGLFFVGVKLIGGNLKQMSGRRLRDVVARTVASPLAAAGLGTLAGALTQSTNAVTFIGINTVAAGLVRARQIVPVIVWANLGTSALVLLATLDIHLLVLLLIGVVGVLHYLELDRSVRFRHAVGALLGIGMLFLGIDLIRSGAAAMREIAELQDIIAYANTSYVLAFLLGAAITMVAQSSATVTVVAIAMTQAGILAFDQTLMIVFGAGVGSGVTVWMMAARLSGTPKQLAMFQVVTKCVGAAVLVPAFAIEHASGVPLVTAPLGWLAPVPAMQLASAYLLYQLVSVLLVSPAIGPLHWLIRRLFPETVEEKLAQPRFLYAGGDSEAETGALLVEREQERLIGFVRDSLDWVREDGRPGRDGQPGPRALREAARSIGGEISDFLASLMDSAPPRETMERLASLHGAQGLLDELAEEVHRLVVHLDSAELSPTLAPAVGSMVESLHLVVLVLLDELESPDEFQRTSLLVLTADRSDMMDGLRRELMRGDRLLKKSEQETLFNVTAGFEHAIWLIRRYLMLVRAAV